VIRAAFRSTLDVNLHLDTWWIMYELVSQEIPLCGQVEAFDACLQLRHDVQFLKKKILDRAQRVTPTTCDGIGLVMKFNLTCRGRHTV
jgi:hypothetical protein